MSKALPLDSVIPSCWVDPGEAMETDDMPQASAAAPGGSAVSASRLSRLFFVLGQVAIQHLVGH